MLKLIPGATTEDRAPPCAGVTMGAAPVAALVLTDSCGAASFDALNSLTGFAGGSSSFATALGGSAGNAGPAGAVAGPLNGTSHA